MKTMYKGVFTVVAATLVASAAIIATNANTKDAAGDEEKQETVSTTVTDTKAVVVEKVDDSAVSTTVKDVEAVAAPSATVVLDKAIDIKKDEVAANASSGVKTAETVSADVAKEGSYPPPPPGPFVEKTEGTAEAAQNIAGKPVAPTKPVIVMEAPKAPEAPTVEVNVDAAASDTVKKELAEAEIKAPDAPKVDITAPVKPAVDVSTPSTSEAVVETDANTNKGEVATETKVVESSEAKASGIEKTEVVAPTPEAPIKASALEMLKAAEKAKATTTVESKVKAAVIEPVMGLSAPEMPKVMELKAPEAPAKPETSTLKAPDAPKPSGMPKVVPMMVPQGFMMPQGMRPPQGVMMPQGMMPSQMINGQRMMMVPVYPMNMGRPAYPYGYQMPFPNMMPQGQFHPGQAVKPNPQRAQQAPAEKTEK
jgi:hypothetical protein